MNTRRFLVFHFTAGASAASEIEYMCNPKADNRVSAHLHIDRKGNVVQLVAFNRQAWHAGKSSWHGFTALNRSTIGIECENYGRLKKMADGSFKTWFGKTVPKDEAVQLKHRHESSVSWWHTWTLIQVDMCIDVGMALVKRYNLDDVVGHEDAAPGRKDDPGPSFAMQEVRKSCGFSGYPKP